MAKPKYKNKKKIDDDTTVYEYSDKQVEHRNREKAKRVQKLSESIDDLRDQVSKDIKSDDSAKRLKALAVALMDQTYERVGNEESAEERGHHGVTVWKKKHLSFNGDKVTIKYTGKSGVKHEKTVEDKAVVSELKELVEEKSKDDYIFECGPEDDRTCVRASDVNDYLDDFGISAKDIRGYHANRLMLDKLKEIRKRGKKLPDDKKEREEQLKEEFNQGLDEVAKEVGHEASTLKSNYLVPALEDAFMDDGTVIEKLDRKKLDRKKSASLKKIASAVARTYVWELLV